MLISIFAAVTALTAAHSYVYETIWKGGAVTIIYKRDGNSTSNTKNASKYVASITKGGKRGRLK